MNAASEQHSSDERGDSSDSLSVHARSTSDPDLMQHDAPDDTEKVSPPLDAHDQARSLLRLIQCTQCSKPFTLPVTLPCGRSLCRSCLPQPYDRERMTWPDLPERRRAVTCPFGPCQIEHTMADCNIDVVLTKVMEVITDVVVKTTSLLEPTPALQEMDTLDTSPPVQYTRPIGRLLQTYNCAAAGQLPYNTDMDYGSHATYEDASRLADDAMLAELLDVCQNELDCQVCYNLMLDPVTTSCGHTLCRKCLVRTLDHSRHCPVCRRDVLLPPSLISHPSNKTLCDLLDGLCPDLVAARKEALAGEDLIAPAEWDTPLFVVTLGFPEYPTFLHIFEPRYRLMLRRALEGDQTFGLVMYNERMVPQEGLSDSHFLRYGTLMRIVNAQHMPDGTSVVELRGISRFKVLTSSILDGYAVGRVERVEDIPLAEEEAIERNETALGPAADGDVEGQLSSMTTQQLLELGLAFVRKMHGRSAPWLHGRLLQAYGGPPHDAATFPYWFASILPTHDMAKYQLLQATSVRQRLKVTARWIRLMEAQRWYHSNSCTIL